VGVIEPCTRRYMYIPFGVGTYETMLTLAYPEDVIYAHIIQTITNI